VTALEYIAAQFGQFNAKLPSNKIDGGF